MTVCIYVNFSINRCQIAAFSIQVSISISNLNCFRENFLKVFEIIFESSNLTVDI